MQIEEDKGMPSHPPVSSYDTYDLQFSGGQPCGAYAARNSLCDYDPSSDQRRKIVNRRNAQELAQAQHDLEHFRQLLGGILAILKQDLNSRRPILFTLSKPAQT